MSQKGIKYIDDTYADTTGHINGNADPIMQCSYFDHHFQQDHI